MSSSSVIQKSVLILLLVALGFGLWQAQSRFRAALLFERSQELQDAWTESPEALTVDTWLTAAEDLYQAIQTDNKAEYLHKYALLVDSERTLLGEGITPEQTQLVLARAIEAHTLGVQAQPTHPVGWAYLARVKALAGQFDEIFDLAMERTYTLGPWNKSNQIMVAQIAQYFWSSMSLNGRNYTRNILELALSNPGNDTPILDLLQGSELLINQLCPQMDQSNLTDASQAACQPE